MALAGCRTARDDAAPLDGSWHRLAHGETLGEVARHYKVPVEDLVELNGIADAEHVEEGMALFIPRPGDASPRARPSNPLPIRRTRQLGAAVTAAPPSDGPLAWPVRAEISSPFGWRDGKPHEGIDLKVADGTEVRAAADGEVVYASDKLRGYGRLVILRHDDHLVTIYAHNSELLVSEGDRVGRGALISRSGHTGHVTAPHLHFEVREDNVPQDPVRYLDPN